MTIASTPRKAGPFIGNGVNGAFPFSFKVFAKDNIQIAIYLADGTPVTAVPDTDYSVTLNPDQNAVPGGQVNYPILGSVQPYLPVNATLTIAGALPYDQPLRLPGGGNFSPSALENELDRTVMQLQQVLEVQSRSLTFPLGEGVIPAFPPIASRANKLLGFDALGQFIGVLPAPGSATQLALDLANAMDPAKGAALVASNDAANYFNAATVEAILQEIGNPKGRFQLDGVNVLKYIPPSEWAAIFAKTSTTDLYVYLQAAMNAEPNLIFPDGRFNTGTKLIPRTDAKLRGINRRGPQLRGLGAITLLEFGINSIDPYIENILFCGSGTTGIAVANTGGTFHDYLIRAHITSCDFAWEMAYGINADLIYLTLEKSTFGFYGTVGGQPSPGASTMVALKSYSVTANLPNLNRVNDCNFAAGSVTAPAVDLSGGIGWVFTDCDWSFGGVALRIANIPLLKFRGTCWFEGNSATNGLIELGATTTNPDFQGVNVANNTCSAFIRYATGSTSGVNLYDSEIALNSPSYVMTDTTTLVNTLPGDGSVRFYGNRVVGGNAANKIVSGTDFRGGKTSPRVIASIDTTGSGTLLYCSDPGATLSRTGTGDVTLTVSHPLSSAASSVSVVSTGRTAEVVRAVGVTTTTIRLQAFTNAGAAVDGIIAVCAYG